MPTSTPPTVTVVPKTGMDRRQYTTRDLQPLIGQRLQVTELNLHDLGNYRPPITGTAVFVNMHGPELVVELPSRRVVRFRVPRINLILVLTETTPAEVEIEPEVEPAAELASA